MERFDMSFKNKKVRVYFGLIVPVIIVAIIMHFVLPPAYQMIPTFLVLSGIAVFYLWVLIDRRRQKGNK
ncbi:hypothetical protein [Planococcus sp. YIM B11945]|uniref:hypothetical protein n=1 Tax=Planococcus sp. YIM B11945 TaxID=3435410 RepID=UPI003D7D365C